MQTTFGRAADFVRRHHLSGRSLALAGLAITFAVVAEQAQANAPAVAAAVEEAMKAARPFTPEPVRYEWTFDGADVDGDGIADFVNPTGEAVREHDDFGFGHFGASRDGGSRHHEGVDYVGKAGQDIGAPIAGQVTRMGYAYGTDSSLKYVEITNEALNYKARVFYVSASVAIGDHVDLGEKIGVLKTLQDKYPGITDHVHLELSEAGERFNAGEVIVARQVRVTGEG